MIFSLYFTAGLVMTLKRMDQVWKKFRKMEKGFLYVMISLGYIPKKIF